jgi:hypothetical protein
LPGAINQEKNKKFNEIHLNLDEGEVDVRKPAKSQQACKEEKQL